MVPETIQGPFGLCSAIQIDTMSGPDISVICVRRIHGTNCTMFQYRRRAMPMPAHASCNLT